MAFVLSPEPPIENWLADLDESVEHAKGLFAHHPVALDLSTTNLDAKGIVSLVASLSERQIRVLGIEGITVADAGETLPPALRAGREGLAFQLPPGALAVENAGTQKQPNKASLFVERPVRSGQSVVFTDGDVTVIGSVGSGAEVIAGGSIHVYGTLRGRAIAGVAGDECARIFCRRVEAEFLAIDSYYKTADDIGADLQSQPIQAWLEGKTLMISALH
jgi:septum site-determining protein MinC